METNEPEPVDLSNGYEGVASEYIRRRDSSSIGVETVERWTRSLPRGAAVLDLGCGSGVPISAVLREAGCTVYGIDASPSMVAAYRRRSPEARVACEAVENSSFFARSFDGVIAVGLMFLLPGDMQREVLRKVASVLTPGGRFLFTSPGQVCYWADMLTGRESRSLGSAEYRAESWRTGLSLVGECEDEGGNHYYDFRLSRSVATGAV